MREVNFSIPNGNKASVYITATLYDRRALDCTSTLPLINSLNHLAYLTTSSARIRDILTVDGGVERLVCVLKEGRSKDEMHMWKWNLAFQCVVNIGVRGTEPVRTRVVEADMVPVIATVLHDYILVVERERQKLDTERQRNPAKTKNNGPRSARLPRDLAQEQASRGSFLEHQMTNSDARQGRRQAPPPSLELAQPFADRLAVGEPSQTAPLPLPPAVFTSPPERTTFNRPVLQHQNRSHDGRNSFNHNTNAGPSTGIPDGTDGFSLRPVRDIDRLPSMVPPLNSAIPSNPESPTTPSAPPVQRGILSPIGRRLRRPSIRHQLSNDDVLMEDVDAIAEDTIVDQEAVDTRDRTDPADGELTPRATTRDEEERDPLSLTIPGTLPPDQDNVDIAQQTPTAATALESLLTQGQNENGNSPAVNGPQPTASPLPPVNTYSNFFLRNPQTSSAIVPLMPRDDDVLMGLQLLAYISKYCDLRHYFQATHLVPRLRIDREVEKAYGPPPGADPLAEPTEDEMEEYLQPDDVNIFPLVEKFTVPHHSKDMQSWACVVMRNLCRKDDARGGTRQCANYKCGKWEDYPRQFAKCRRCKRTKYCSKVSSLKRLTFCLGTNRLQECQRDSWSMHRHWCQTTPP